MKSTLNIKKESKPIKFPVLAHQINGKYLVAFNSQTSGTVVNVSSESPFDLLFHSDDWTPVTSKSDWVIAPAGTEVILEQTEV